MFLKKILPKLHKFLFPSYHERYLLRDKVYEDARENNLQTIHHLQESFKEIKELKNKIQELQKRPKPTMADLMRECLGLLPLDFTNVIPEPDLEESMHMSPQDLEKRNNQTGLPRDFLDTLDKDKRATYVAQLYQIWQMEVFPVMIDYYINLQGNWSFKKALDDMQLFAGRLSCNGIYLIKNKTKAGHDEYKDRSKPPEEFDEHELDEGFDINNLGNKK